MAEQKCLKLHSSTWGAGQWDSIFSVGFTFPDGASQGLKTKTKLWLTNMRMGCLGCETKYGEALLKFPLTDDVFLSRQTLLTWMVSIRNYERVNRGVPALSFAEVADFYAARHNKAPLYAKNDCPNCEAIRMAIPPYKP
jgi:hypothetical protein